MDGSPSVDCPKLTFRNDDADVEAGVLVEAVATDEEIAGSTRDGITGCSVVSWG